MCEWRWRWEVCRSATTMGSRSSRISICSTTHMTHHLPSSPGGGVELRGDWPRMAVLPQSNRGSWGLHKTVTLLPGLA